MRRLVLLVAAFAAVTACLTTGTAAAARESCSGTEGSPGVISGTYSNLVIQGVCVVGGGATVSGNVTLLPGSTLAAFSDFTVSGNIHVMSGATLIGGQDPDAGRGASAVFHVAGSVI